ncbi:cation-transporting ATPase pma1 [Arthroderma uncinatum]|uniref:cation-transporting ATPase pma1 n=1 Tax=Arthroderma uncinatum TaxID=74035 RepID=UPI00144A7949|nr:cation-transporting ATPase pma1 [Arthroderma uncinatum]KAF3481665.1 cation-transporting ATPase pma1 [Arthroderma uncinatum]
MSPQDDAPAGSDDKEAADLEKGEEGKGTADGPKRITFQQPRRDDERPTRRTSGERERRRSRSRSRHSFSSVRGGTGNNALTGIPIEFRTLSIQISESRNVSTDVAKEGSSASVHNDKEYFEKLDFHILSKDTLCQQFNVSSDQGLSAEAANTRLQRDGKNTIPRRRPNYLRKILGYVFGGFCSVLWVGVIIFFVCWKPLSNPPSPANLGMAVLVLIVIFLQAGFSAFQDWSTNRVMNSILDLLPVEAQVLRNGEIVRIPATDLVAGDIVHISSGNKVPADMRLISSSGDVRFDRSVLTGESDEVEGALDATENNFLETRNIAFMGTGVTNGHAVGLVVLTGGRSLMGRIAMVTTNVKEKPTLIQKEISRFIRIIVGLTCVLASLLLFSWVGWIRIKHAAFMDVVAMLNNVLGCVVAFIPEGMPVGVALTMMMIANRMKSANILPKGLSTVETLGCVNVLCSDKTGTLTQNLMTVKSIGLVDQEYTVEELNDALKEGNHGGVLGEFHRGSILCNDAFFEPATISQPLDERAMNGNATDCAILRLAEAALPSKRVVAEFDRVFQIPFNSQSKWMLTMHKPQGTNTSSYDVFVKGAPDVLLPMCTSYWSGKEGRVMRLNESAKRQLSEFQEKLSRKAERVILLCQRRYTPQAPLGSNYFGDEIKTNCIKDLTVIGLYGIIDPPRPEARSTIASCRRAGIRFFMVTGDFGLTATAIARDIGIFTGTADPDRVRDFDDKTISPVDKNNQVQLADTSSSKSLLVEGPEISALTQDKWDIICKYEEIVFARTTPEQKLRIVEELKARDNVVAVTGDGVNDAPALRASDVGIAVVSGSDVAIEAADLVLLDKFDSIVEAVRLGRLVFQNLQKLISYLLPAGSWSEIWPVLMNQFIGVPLPLSSFLMIIICVFTDLFLSLSLIMEKEEFDLLSLPPRNHKKDHLINFKIYAQSYLFIGVMETVCAHAMFFLYMYRKAGIPFHSLVFAYEKYSDGFYGYTKAELTNFNNVGQCVYFVTLVVLQWGNILSIRNKRLSILQADPIRKQRRNPWLAGAVLVSLAIAVFVTQTPGINRLFNTAPVPIEHWLLPIPLAVGILCMDEFRKLLVRLFPRGPIARIAW